MEQQLTQSTVIDGFLYDNETGECLGAVDSQFHVHDQASAEWVLEKATAIEQDIAGLKARRDALLKNMDVMIGEKERQRDGLLYKFSKELEEFAKANLPKGKKSWTCPYGTVSFRATTGGLKVNDADLALQVAQTEGMQNAIKVTESFLVSKLTDVQKELIVSKLGSHDSRWREAFEDVEPGESVTVKTGL